MKKSNKIFRVLALIAIIAAVINVLPILPAVVSVMAHTDEPYSFTTPVQDRRFTQKDLSLANSNFAQGNPTTFSTSIAGGWTAAQNNSTNTIGAVLNVTAFDDFRGKNNLSDLSFMTVNPLASSTSDNNILAITNKTENGTARMGYTSPAISEFYADGYFEVTVDFYAVKSFNAIYLIPTDTSAFGNKSYPKINIHQWTNEIMGPNKSQWQTASFYVHTDKLESITFKLGLYLGTRETTSTGVAYYDNIKVTALNESRFTEKLATSRQAYPDFTEYVDLTNKDDVTELTPKIFEDFNSSNTMFKATRGNTTNAQTFPYISLYEVPTKLNLDEADGYQINGNTSNDTGVMLLCAYESGTSAVLKNPLTINRNTIYALSFYTLSPTSAYLRIRDINADSLDLPDNNRTPYDSGFQQIKNSHTNSSAAHNNWILNTVYVIGESLYDNNVNVEFWIGSGYDTTGYLLVDDFSIQKVSHEHYEKYKSATNATELNLDKSQSTTTINNSSFNIGTIRSVETPYPLKATGWTVEAEQDDKILNGIVNTSEDHWITEAFKDNGKAYGNAINPGAIGLLNQNNNVYMMQNLEDTYQKISSESFPLSASSTNIISFDACTYIPTGNEINFYAAIEITREGNIYEIAQIDLSRKLTQWSNTLQPWTNYRFAVETSTFTGTNLTVSFYLGLPQKLTSGVAYIDNVRLETDTKKPGDTFVSLKDPSKIADINGTSIFFVPEDTTQAFAHFDIGNDILQLNTMGWYHTKISNTMTQELSPSTYYEYTVSVALGVIEHDITYDDLEEEHDYGISFTLADMKGGFENIKAEDLYPLEHNTDGFTDLKFYINPDRTVDLSLVIEFGNDVVPVLGSALIKSTNLVEIDEGIFDLKKKEIEKEKLARIITTSVDAEEKEDTKETGEPTNLSWLVVPTIITGVALIIALAGALIRKFNFRLHIGRHHTSYALDDKVKTTKPKSLKATKTAKATKEIEKDTADGKA